MNHGLAWVGSQIIGKFWRAGGDSEKLAPLPTPPNADIYTLLMRWLGLLIKKAKINIITENISGDDLKDSMEMSPLTKL